MKAVLHGSEGSTILDATLFTFGSSPDNVLVIDNKKVSAHHAEIRSEENRFSITDLGSIHGTYVNGERLDFNSPRSLNSGDSITIGDSVYRFEIDETIPIIAGQVGENAALFDDNQATLEVTHSKETISETSEDQHQIEADALQHQSLFSNVQQLNTVPYIPPDFDGPLPGYMTMKQVRRRDRRFMLIGLGILVVIALAIGGYFFFNRSTPEKTLDTFCNAMQGQDYQTAYNQFSDSLQSNVTELEFASTLRANGKVNICTHSSASTKNNKTTANVTIVTGSGQASNSSIILTADKSNVWKMSLFPTTPSMTLTAFCNALQNKDYPTAYAQLASGIKRVNAEAQFEAYFTGATCSYSNASPSGSTATANMTFKTSSGQAVDARVVLIQDGDSNNNWKINSIQFGTGS